MKNSTYILFITILLILVSCDEPQNISALEEVEEVINETDSIADNLQSTSLMPNGFVKLKKLTAFNSSQEIVCTVDYDYDPDNGYLTNIETNNFSNHNANSDFYICSTDYFGRITKIENLNIRYNSLKETAFSYAFYNSDNFIKISTYAYLPEHHLYESEGGHSGDLEYVATSDTLFDIIVSNRYSLYNGDSREEKIVVSTDSTVSFINDLNAMTGKARIKASYEMTIPLSIPYYALFLTKIDSYLLYMLSMTNTLPTEILDISGRDYPKFPDYSYSYDFDTKQRIEIIYRKGESDQQMKKYLEFEYID